MPFPVAVDDVQLLDAVSTVFRAFGQTVFFLDRDFRVLRDGASPVAGFPPDELRQALRRGETREGWRIAVAEEHGPRIMSVNAAPLNGDPLGTSARYVVILQPANELPPGTTHFFGMVARSEPMMKIFAVIRGLATSDAPVLIAGEPGSGRETVGRAIHASSSRRRGRFITVDCSALPIELLEAEIFGNGRAAMRTRGGSMFLRDLQDMPSLLQSKLLREMNEGPIEARIIAPITDPRHAAIDGTLIYFPPLRARRDDIEPIAQALLGRATERHARDIRLGADAIRALIAWSWPGHVRELESTIDYAVAVTRGSSIHADDLPHEISNVMPARVPPPDGDEASAIRATLDAHHWNREAAAAALGISRTTLWRKMRELGVR